MALSYSQLSAITRKKYIPKLVDNIFDSNVLLKRWKDKGDVYESVDGGETIMCPLNYAQNSSGGWFSGLDTMDTTDVESITSAEYQWVQMYDTITISGQDERKNSGDAAVLKLIKEKVKIAEMTGQDRLSTGIYNAGTTSKAVIGLRAIVGTANTIGGISQSTYSWWQGKVATDTTLSIAVMAGRMSACRIGSDGPSIITTDSTNWDRYHALLQPQQRFQDKETASGGFSSLMFMGKPVVDDASCPSGYMFFLNEKYLNLWYHKDANFKFEDFQKPVNQDAKVGKILFMGALGSSNNRMHGVLTSLAA